MDNRQDVSDRFSTISTIGTIGTVGSETLVLSEPYRRFQILKSTAFGLGSPQGERLAVRPIRGYGDDTQILYHTNSLSWYKERVYLPPPFKLFYGPKRDRSADSDRTEIMVGSIKYKGWEGLVGMRAEIEVFNHDERLVFMDEIPTERQQQRSLTIRRKGMGRDYPMELSPSGLQFKWKGTKQTLQMLDDDAPECNGNLKLVSLSAQPEVLAVFKNRTDAEIMGLLTIFESARDGGEVLMEEIVCSCLAVICAERLSGRGWLGGIGKKSSPKAASSSSGQSWRRRSSNLTSSETQGV